MYTDYNRARGAFLKERVDNAERALGLRLALLPRGTRAGHRAGDFSPAVGDGIGNLSPYSNSVDRIDPLHPIHRRDELQG